PSARAVPDGLSCARIPVWRAGGRGAVVLASAQAQHQRAAAIQLLDVLREAGAQRSAAPPAAPLVAVSLAPGRPAVSRVRICRAVSDARPAGCRAGEAGAGCDR